MIGVEEIAKRNGLTLYRGSRPGQYKAHCPVCKDNRRTYHLYVSAERDVFFCHKCGASGGAIAFYAWLRGISWEAAKAELYPPAERSNQRKRHPAESLTRAQLAAMGFTLRTPSCQAPAGIDPRQWSRRRQAELDWIWSQWQEYCRVERERDLFWARLAKADRQKPAQ